MEGDSEEWWYPDYKPEKAGLYMYYFECDTPWGRSSITDYGGGTGFFSSDGKEFQLTVYEQDFHTPDWLKGGIIYQIFPDRFRRSKDFDYASVVKNCKREERIYHEDWYEDVDIEGKPSTGYLACDFFCGSLNGISEKLDYIKSLGINIIYLNPIFEARSSHRYDTADYLNVDPILGGNEAFTKLVKEAQAKGITLILDGVFSHTGADSRYFNKFDRYDGTGGRGSEPSGAG